MRVLLALALLAMSGCSQDDDCAEAEQAAERQQVAVDEVRSLREKAEGQGSVTDTSPSVQADLRAQDLAATRLLSQIVVGSPDCFSVAEVATAREYLDSTD